MMSQCQYIIGLLGYITLEIIVTLIQIIFHLLKLHSWTKFNNNKEGLILNRAAYLTTLQKFPLNAIEEFKSSLRSYNDVLSDHHQDDACECLIIFMDILHEGTKHSLVSGVTDDDNAVSFTNIMFTSVYLKSFTCKFCYNSLSSH